MSNIENLVNRGWKVSNAAHDKGYSIAHGPDFQGVDEKTRMKAGFSYMGALSAATGAMALERAHSFELAEEVTDFCRMTANKQRDGPLPFDCCWIEGPIMLGEERLLGLRIDTFQQRFHLADLYISQHDPSSNPHWGTEELQEVPEHLRDAIVVTFYPERGHAAEETRIIGLSVTLVDHPELHALFKEANLAATGGISPTFVLEGTQPYFADLARRIRTFVSNWHDLVAGPQVRLFTLHRSIRIRTLGGVHAAPPTTLSLPSTKVILKPELQRYVRQARLASRSPYSHKFWVRGHWRTLRDESHWTKKLNVRVWVRPHIKGFGDLVEKHYEQVGEQTAPIQCAFNGPGFSSPGSLQGALHEENDLPDEEDKKA